LSLLEKDELISALVRELEDAAEQLDRFHRTGARTAGPSSPAGDVTISSEFRRSIMEESVASASGGISQHGETLTRIESQLAAVYDIVSDLKNNGVSNDHYQNRYESLQTHYHEPQKQEEEAPKQPSWDAIKSQMLEAEAEESPQEAEPTAAESVADADLLRLITETPSPKPADFTSTDIQYLKSVIEERDVYIIQLNRLFRTSRKLKLPADWAALANVPSEMQIRVEALAQNLDVQVRLGEVEISLERAKIARERSQLQAEREFIEKHLRRLGVNSLAELDAIGASTGTTADRRWLRFLGPNSGKK
jgi:hypothetical protein